MKMVRIPALRVAFLLFCALPVVLENAPAQAGSNEWKANVAMEMQQTPQFTFRGAKSKKTDPQDWLEVEVAFTPQVKERLKAPFIDGVEVRFFVLVNNEKNEILTHTVNHLNVPLNVETYSVAYVSPVALARLVGKLKATQADVKAVAAEVHYEGKMVGFAQKGFPKDGAWRTEANQISDMMRSLNKSPFALLYPDRYPELAD